MLFAWHLPVPPYVRYHAEHLEIRLLVQGDDELPQQVMLRCEPDNEEWLLTMQPENRAVLPAIRRISRCWLVRPCVATVLNFSGTTGSNGLGHWGSASFPLRRWSNLR